MPLPKLPYRVQHHRQEIIAFRGLNRTENTQEGELRDAQNLSTAKFPCISQRGKRTALSGYSAPTDIFEWDGHLLVVDGGVLYYDGEAIDNVSEGKKQCAVVNTKLCIFPDKVYIDLTNNSFGHLDALAETTGHEGSVSFTTNSITAEILPIVARDVTYITFGGDATVWNPAIYTYGTDRAAVEACYHDGAWDTEMLAALEKLSGIFSTVGTDEWLSYQDAGKIFIPIKQNNSYVYSYANAQAGARPDKSGYNTEGYYGVFTEVNPGIYSSMGDSSVRWHYDVYLTGMETPVFSASFRVGDAVSISGTTGQLCDVRHAVIREINTETNTLVFDDNTFPATPEYFKQLDESTTLGASVSQALKLSDQRKWYVFTPTEDIDPGSFLWINTDDGVLHVLVNGEEIKTYQTTMRETAPPSGAPTYTVIPYDNSEDVVIIQRDVPDLDFICEKDNRLWGVSNRQSNEIYNAETGEIETFTSRCIYVSALGDPANFWVFDGVDTDSYQVAVGSEGDFTAICSFDGGVCCWKEQRMHKVLGSYPSEYYVHESRIEGVAAGSEKSLTVINEVLYYNGATGVYAYAGGAPNRIGYELGGMLQGAAGGTDGKRWYLSGVREDGEAELLAYDLTHRLWMREDATRAEAFARVGGVLHFLAGGAVYQAEQGADDVIAWMAEFVPFTETETLHKYYLRLILRLDMSAGSTLTVEVREDFGAWHTVLQQDAAAEVAKVVEIPNRRCDRFTVRLSGTGNVLIRAMTREFIKGSERA